MLLLACIGGSLLLFFAAVYFAIQAMRSQSKLIHAYLAGRADALEEILKGLSEKTKDQRPVKLPEVPGKSEKFEPINGC